jgi:hypothetical protein
MRQLVLNRPDSADPSLSKGADISKQLKSKIDALKLHFYDLDSGGVDYKAMGDSAAFAEYEQTAKGLAALDLDRLSTREAKLAFWINIYNALVVHGILALHLKRSVKEVSGFFAKVSYHIGGHVFSLDDIEHGILRGNKKKHLFSRKPFRGGDDRIRFRLQPMDLRIHFALVCGSTSCPPIDVYDEMQIDAQLDMVADAFINSDDVIIHKKKGQLQISRIFKWYKEDFDGTEGLLRLFIRYRFDPDDRAFLEKLGRHVKIVYKPYDWSLNRA